MLHLTRAIILTFILTMGSYSSTSAHEFIDFEGFPAGTVVFEVFGDGGSGPIFVEGTNPRFSAGTNAAIIFDTANPTGGDPDLGTPNSDFGGPGLGVGGKSGSPFQNDAALGNALIIAENLTDANGDGLIDDPDDEGGIFPVTLAFDFSIVGPVTPRPPRPHGPRSRKGDPAGRRAGGRRGPCGSPPPSPGVC